MKTQNIVLRALVLAAVLGTAACTSPTPQRSATVKKLEQTSIANKSSDLSTKTQNTVGDR